MSSVRLTRHVLRQTLPAALPRPRAWRHAHLGSGSGMNSNRASQPIVVTHITPTGLFHDTLQCWRVRKRADRSRQIAIGVKSFADEPAQQGHYLVEIEVEHSAKHRTVGMAHLQACHPTSRLDYPQHLIEAGGQVVEITHHKS